MAHFTLDETIVEVRRYNVEAPEGSTTDEIRELAYTSQYRSKFSEVQEVVILDENGNTYDRYFPCKHERTRMDDGISSCLDCGDRIDCDVD